MRSPHSPGALSRAAAAPWPCRHAQLAPAAADAAHLLPSSPCTRLAPHLTPALLLLPVPYSPQALTQFGKDVVAGTAKKFFKSGELSRFLRLLVRLLVELAGAWVSWEPGPVAPGAKARLEAGLCCPRCLLQQSLLLAMRAVPLRPWRVRSCCAPARLWYNQSDVSSLASTSVRFHAAAEVPKEPLDKGVAVIVGNTVETIVKDPTKVGVALCGGVHGMC